MNQHVCVLVRTWTGDWLATSRKSGGLPVNLSIMSLYLQLCVRVCACVFQKVTHHLYWCMQRNPTPNPAQRPLFPLPLTGPACYFFFFACECSFLCFFFFFLGREVYRFLAVFFFSSSLSFNPSLSLFFSCGCSKCFLLIQPPSAACTVCVPCICS